jgi:GMP synthase (glutamine-hydrolysing)
MATTAEEILILDFGSQYTQLIGRRIRESHVYSEIVPFHTPLDEIRERNPKGLVLSGGPSSVYDKDAPDCDPEIFNLGIPVLGICYGMFIIAKHLGGTVEPADDREYGSGSLQTSDTSVLLEGMEKVWMSHGDRILEPPPGFGVTATSDQTIAAIESPDRGIFGLQFHPEVSHTDNGADLLHRFTFDICKCNGSWSLGSFLEAEVERIKQRVGNGRVLCAISGGVDSTVAASIVSRAVGDQLFCLFVDTGLLRKNEFTKVLKTLRDNLNLNVDGIDASSRFLNLLDGVTDPEKKRKIIGNEFIRIFEEEAEKIGDIDFLVQGTLYPDVIESVSVRGPSQTIKSHHNVGGLPKDMNLKLIEPLRELFKDEVRQIGTAMEIPDELVWRQPFPGPGLAIRIMGEITPDNIRMLQESDEILVGEIKDAGLYREVWQSFAVLLPIKSVGVMGDLRTYEYTIAIRAVTSTDGMTADWARLPYELIGRIANRIVNEVRGVNRVVYDVTSKPPGTIEWE